MMMRLVLFASVLAWTAAVRADVTQFPYVASVMADDVYVRSGPGMNYYATGRLRREDQVTVVRHDPGGWFMIAPPPGSISWIEASAVERHGARGTINVPPGDAGQPGLAIVRIGSTLSDDHTLSGRQLVSGDEIEVLGEQTLMTDAGPIPMLKITPPPREYRWVKGTYIVPTDAALQRQINNDPFAVPAAQRTPEHLANVIEAESSESSTALLKAPALPATVRASAGFAETAAPDLRLALMEVDNQYADMMALEISQWRLDGLRRSYLALKEEASPAMTRQIEVRLAALAERQKIYDQYAKFAALTAATDQRDAELLNRQPGQIAQGPDVMLANAESTDVNLGAPSPSAPGTDPATLGQYAPPALLNPPGSSRELTTPAAAGEQRLSGAGIVQTLTGPTNGVPKHVLITADGKFLAWLSSTEVNLDQYVGQTLGLYGQRARDPRLNADLIQVTHVTPVQLAK